MCFIRDHEGHYVFRVRYVYLFAPVLADFDRRAEWRGYEYGLSVDPFVGCRELLLGTCVWSSFFSVFSERDVFGLLNRATPGGPLLRFDPMKKGILGEIFAFSPESMRDDCLGIMRMRSWTMRVSRTMRVVPSGNSLR